MDPSPNQQPENSEQDKTEDDGGDTIVTIGEVMEQLDRCNETAEVLLGSQDDSVCTYPEGYKPRQALFCCLTCTPSPTQAGFCYGCSIHCHEDHDVVELYTKRSFKCDCGNSKFGGKKCQLFEEKEEVNKYNIYNHNYNGKFCVCDDTYPSENTQEDMLQCEICEDWFHATHINLTDSEIPKPSEGTEAHPVSLICLACVKKLPFLRHFGGGNLDDPVCHSKLAPVAEENESPKAVMIEKLRARLCRCSDCKAVYDNLQCEFLLDDEDDLSNFEQESKKKAEENRKTDDENMRDLVKEVGMDGAINVIGAVHDLKRKLGSWLEQMGSEGNVIKKEDVTKFFGQLNDEIQEKKRARMEQNP